MANQSKRSNWHSSQPGQVSSTLILDPVPGDILDELNTVCEKFEQMHGNRVEVCPRAGKSVKADAKPGPLRRLGCAREDCLHCQSPGSIKGGCEKNSGTYKILARPASWMERKSPAKERLEGIHSLEEWSISMDSKQRE